MLRSKVRGGLVLVATVLLAAAALQGLPLPLDVMPAPTQVSGASGAVEADGGLVVTLPESRDARVRAGIDRTFAAWQRRIGRSLFRTTGGLPLVVDCRAAGPDLPFLGEDESYALNISPDGIDLTANTAVGTLRGLATLEQLLREDGGRWVIPCATIRDQPRFPWRGLLVDVSRHWEPVDVILRTLDGMALVKLNVLHWHLTDDQGFRVEVKSHPELAGEGSDGHFYTQEQIREVVAYAARLGIRVVPEFDLPGHATSWLVSHPELASAPGPYRIERHWGVFNPVMDPTNAAAYALLSDVFREMAALFPDPYFHIGGDENNGFQWDHNPRIQAFIARHHLGGDAGLQVYFDQKVTAILKGLGKRPVGWNEILQPGLPASAVIESWKNASSLADAARLGYDGILANGFYIDQCHSAARYYATDPLPTDEKLSPDQARRVLGGEATMWGEWVTPATIDSRIWPTTAAIAERLWSPADVRDPADMYRRLAIVSERLAEIGLRHQSYRAPLLVALLGREDSPPARAALGAFVAAIQPVQNYQRGHEQPTSDQWTPLIGVPDAAAPDSAAARRFATDVARFLAARSSRAAEPVRRTLIAWQQSAEAVARLARGAPGLAPAAPVAVQLADASRVGLAALDRVTSAAPADAAWTADALGRLGDDAEPHDAVELPVIAALKRLVAAASLPTTEPHASTPGPDL